MKQSLPLSTHVLYLGTPAEGVTVKLFKLVNDIWLESNNYGVTDKDGRIANFQMVNNETNGTYKLKFETFEFLKLIGVASIYPYIEIFFNLKGDSHQHVPLVLSTYGFSTYKGS